jgi:hypothetical protein
MLGYRGRTRGGRRRAVRASHGRHFTGPIPYNYKINIMAP